MKSFVLLSVLIALFSYVYAETTCESHKKNSRTSAHGFSMDIQCDEQGRYKQMQCTPEGVTPKFCACFSHDRQLSTISKNVKSCECHMAKGAAEDAGKSGCDLPLCAPSGKFQPMQTDCAGKKHCVNPVTGAKTMELREGQTCPTA